MTARESRCGREARPAHMVRRTSTFTGAYHERLIRLDIHDYVRWRNGEPIQDAMPYLSKAEREYLITGVPEEEWQGLFGEEEQ